MISVRKISSAEKHRSLLKAIFWQTIFHWQRLHRCRTFPVGQHMRALKILSRNTHRALFPSQEVVLSTKAQNRSMVSSTQRLPYISITWICRNILEIWNMKNILFSADIPRYHFYSRKVHVLRLSRV